MTQEKTNRSKKELKDVGFALPVGISDSAGKLHKGFAFKPWRLKEEKELGELKKELEDARMPTYISAVLSTMLTRVGQHDFTKMDKTQKGLALTQMYTADIFYMYIMLRKENVSHELKLDFGCPHCGRKIKFVGDLNTVDVVCVDDLAALDCEYELTTPINIRGKETKKLSLTALKWNTYEMLTDKHINEGNAIEYFLLNSIVGSDVQENMLVLAEDELDELVKNDYAALSDLVTENTPGPEMAIETLCTNIGCKEKVFVRIEWEKHSFFEHSSQ